MVTVKEKQKFINWLFKTHKLKKRESVWILEYIKHRPELLEKVKFVENAKYTTFGLAIGLEGTKAIPFRFYYKHIVTTDAEKAFHKIRVEQNDLETIYIEIPFNSFPKELAMVLEENPHDDVAEYTVSEETEEIVKQSLIDFQRKQIMAKIDEALDNRDEEAFLKLTLELALVGQEEYV